MMRNILITNDDGIFTDGIIRLVTAAKKYGNVWVIAPESQRSCMSHCITLREPIEVWEVDYPVPGVKAYATTGTPADCVRFGRLNIVEGDTDVVLSGINFGFNSGSDIQYSATVGAALEASQWGIQAIALSEGADECHEVTDVYLDKILEEYIDKRLSPGQIWNINFPKCSLASFNGILTDRKVSPVAFFRDTYTETITEDGRRSLMISGIYNEDAPEGTDFRAIVDGFISVSILNNIQ